MMRDQVEALLNYYTNVLWSIEFFISSFRSPICDLPKVRNKKLNWLENACLIIQQKVYLT